MAARDDIRTRVQASADAAVGPRALDLRVAIGLPGSRIQVRGATQDTGKAWTAPSFLDSLLVGIGGEIDELVGGGLGFAIVNTNGVGVAPTLGSSLHTGVPVKDEALNTLRVNFSPVYASAPFVVASLDGHSLLYYVEYSARGVGEVTLTFRDGLGAVLGINSRVVMVGFAGS